MLERDVQRAVMEWLSVKGIFHWRMNNAGIFDAKTGGYRFHGLKGVSDILGIMPDGSGRILAIEVKRPGGKMTEAQKIFQQRIAELGGIATCVSSVAELEADLAEVMATGPSS